MSADYVRLCLTCSKENTPEVMRCECGALLAGLDLTARVALLPPATDLPAENPSTAPDTADAPPGPRCPHADCGQENPPGSTRCLYCDRPLDSTDDGLSGEQAGIPCLISLPGKLRERFRILRALPATGAEAELLIVQATAPSDAPEIVAKIYRNGIHPDRDILERIGRIDPAHRVHILESGLADGFTFELMEFCRAGSLRDLLRQGQPTAERLHKIIAELAGAIAAVHQAGLIHRDLKPENVLVRSAEPLDLVLTDFSIASLQNATLHFTSAARTLAYGAPETLSGVINQKADWWSLGMMLLEAATGSHPFAGLSDAVILHRLTTRAIDLSTVDDAKLKQLLRGLLLRDPKNRWGEAEITRWLAGDPHLPEIFAEESATQARRPYQIGHEECFTPEQLAAGLAKNWDKALSDLDNGLLMNWLRTELQDQNRVRFLIDLNLERTLHVDLRLLRLLIDLAPGIPPVWRGDSLTLRSILQHADRALKNDADAIQWLDTLYELRVLETYAAAGNAECADISQRWQAALTQFNTAWQEALTQIKVAGPAATEGVMHFDEVVYGRHNGPLRPHPRQLHARLLALAYDPAWATRLREHLRRVTGQLAIDAPWLLALGDVARLPSSHLLAMENLLPEARKQSKRLQEQARQSEAEAQALTQRLQVDTALAIAQMQQAARGTVMTNARCAELQAAIEQFSGLSAQLRAQGRADASYQKLRKQIARLEPTASRIRRLIDTLLERRAENRGWFNQQTLGFFVLALFLLPMLVNQALFYPLIFAGLFFSAWRLLPNFFTTREIRAQARKLDSF